MAFSDPTTVTINAVAADLYEVSSRENGKSYRSADGNVDMQIDHSYGRRESHRIRLHRKKVSSDPMSPALNKPFDEAITFSVNRDPVGFTVAETKQLCDALFTLLTATSGANTTKLLGGQS